MRGGVRCSNLFQEEDATSTLVEADDGFVDDLYNPEELGREALATYGFASIESKLEAKRQAKARRERKERRANWLLASVRSVLRWWWRVCYKQRAKAIGYGTTNPRYGEDASSLFML